MLRMFFSLALIAILKEVHDASNYPIVRNKNSRLGDELSVSYLYYSSSIDEANDEANIEAKAYCSELISFGMGILKGPFPFRMKLALLNYTHIMGYLFDRSNESYYVCEIILREFLDEVEQFYLAQDAENRKNIITLLFWDNADRLIETKSYLDTANRAVKANSNEQLEFVRNENVDKHIKLT